MRDSSVSIDSELSQDKFYHQLIPTACRLESGQDMPNPGFLRSDGGAKTVHDLPLSIGVGEDVVVAWAVRAQGSNGGL
ncbi:MAG: hypothetical protein M3132_00620 [Actinomycetia bacterium]|nr:hypothetical protein [Actinomycetes bacterium]